jgi:hypothetical protein
MKTRIQVDLVSAFAAGFIAAALATNIFSGLFSAFGFTGARLIGSVGIEVVAATVGGLVNIAVNRRASDIS